MIPNNTDFEPYFNSPTISCFMPSDMIFSKTNRLVRFHYTSANALLNILSETPNLRFTDIRFMNDRSEMVYYVKCLLDYLAENRSLYPFCQEVVNALLLKKHSEQEYRDLSVSSVSFEESKKYPYLTTRSFVFCMSEAKDSLTMWNYYVHNGKYEGYNIGFDVYNFLKSFDTDQEGLSDPLIFYYGKVLYREKEQRKEIEELVNLIEKCKTHNDIDFCMTVLRRNIESYGLFFKHDAFKDEKEYRIVIQLAEGRIFGEHKYYANNNAKQIKQFFFERNGVLVPYLSVPFNKDAVKKITVSPIIEMGLVQESLSELLKQNGYSATIEASTIPIRY